MCLFAFFLFFMASGLCFSPGTCATSVTYIPPLWLIPSTYSAPLLSYCKCPLLAWITSSPCCAAVVLCRDLSSLYVIIVSSFKCLIWISTKDKGSHSFLLLFSCWFVLSLVPWFQVIFSITPVVFGNSPSKFGLSNKQHL